MPIKGNLAKMGALADRLGELATVPSRAARAAADGINEALHEEFEAGADPYGKPWAKLADRTLLKHGPPPLTETGEMAEGSHARPAAGAGIEISIPFPGGIHQTGAARKGWRMPARKILPEGGELPKAWQEAIDGALTEAFGATMGGGRA